MYNRSKVLTRKNAAVLPPAKAPYLILVCLARSSALSIGDSIRSTVKKAARFAVYEDIMIRVKNHHIPATIRVDTALKIIMSPVVIARAVKKYYKKYYCVFYEPHMNMYSILRDSDSVVIMIAARLSCCYNFSCAGGIKARKDNDDWIFNRDRYNFALRRFMVCILGRYFTD